MNREQAKEWLEHYLKDSANITIVNVIRSTIDNRAVIRYKRSMGTYFERTVIKEHYVNPWQYFPWLMNKVAKKVNMEEWAARVKAAPNTLEDYKKSIQPTIFKVGDTIRYEVGGMTSQWENEHGTIFEKEILMVDQIREWYGVQAEYGQDKVPFNECTLIHQPTKVECIGCGEMFEKDNWLGACKDCRGKSKPQHSDVEDLCVCDECMKFRAEKKEFKKLVRFGKAYGATSSTLIDNLIHEGIIRKDYSPWRERCSLGMLRMDYLMNISFKARVTKPIKIYKDPESRS